jgi:ketosteroid isomerase-like protein
MDEADRDGSLFDVVTGRRPLIMGMMLAPTIAAAGGAAGAAGPAKVAAPGTGVDGRRLYEGRRDAFLGKTPGQRMQELIDREELRELTAIYAHRVAQGVSIADLYTDDAVFIVNYPNRPKTETRGRAALDKLFEETAHRTVTPLPMIHNHIVEVHGDNATGICSNELRMVENGKSMIGSGYYLDQMRRVNGHWRFVVRDMHFIHWVPIQEGWATQGT